MEKIRKLLSHFVNGHRSEKRILTGPDQQWLPFENSEEFQAARAEAEAQAAAVVQTYTVQRKAAEKEAARRIASQPPATGRADHRRRRRAEELRDARRANDHRLRHDRDAGLHAARTARAGEEVSKICLLGSIRLRDRVARAADLAGRRRSLRHERGGRDRRGQVVPPSADLSPTGPVRRQRLDAQPFDAAEHREPGRVCDLALGRLHDPAGAAGRRRRPGRDELPHAAAQNIPAVIAGDAKSRRLAEKVAEARAQGDDSLLAKMWVYSGLHLAPYNIFDFRVSRHRDGPDEFFRNSRCKVQGDCFSGNRSVVLHSDERLEFVACWGHARRKVVEATTYQPECDLLLGMIQALYDVETRAKELTWQDRQALRSASRRSF